jgi:hypothetical protein
MCRLSVLRVRKIVGSNLVPWKSYNDIFFVSLINSSVQIPGYALKLNNDVSPPNTLKTIV